MARRNFTKAVQRQALQRSGFVCESIAPTGVRCSTEIGRGKPVEYDHVIPDWMGGEPAFENCAALCRVCHKIKTALDAVDRARAKRRSDRHDGVTDPHRRKVVSRGFPPAPKQTPATRPLNKWFGPSMGRAR